MNESRYATVDQVPPITVILRCKEMSLLDIGVVCIETNRTLNRLLAVLYQIGSDGDEVRSEPTSMDSRDVAQYLNLKSDIWITGNPALFSFEVTEITQSSFRSVLRTYAQIAMVAGALTTTVDVGKKLGELLEAGVRFGNPTIGIESNVEGPFVGEVVDSSEEGLKAAVSERVKEVLYRTRTISYVSRAIGAIDREIRDIAGKEWELTFEVGEHIVKLRSRPVDTGRSASPDR